MNKPILRIELNFDDRNLDRAKHFFSFYEPEAFIIGSNTGSPLFIGASTPRTCLFCKRTEPQTSFKNDAHAIPQFMGNRDLLFYSECDACNKKFSKYEDSFAKYFGVIRTIVQIKGKNKKVPQFIDEKSGLDVSIGKEGFIIKYQHGTEIINVDLENKTLELKTEKHTYRPIHIPKMMIKMALSMLGESEAENYQRLIEFVTSNKKDSQYEGKHELQLFEYVIPGPPKFRFPIVQLYKRKDDSALCFQRVVVLCYGQHELWMVLPFGNKDEHLIGKDIDIPIFPLLVDASHFEFFGQYQESLKDFSSGEKRQGEKLDITFSFNHAEYQMGETN